MEIRFPSTDAPHYLPTIVFSRGGDLINIEIVDHKNTQKALYSIDREKFMEAMVMLGCIKMIEGEQVVRIKDF